MNNNFKKCLNISGFKNRKPSKKLITKSLDNNLHDRRITSIQKCFVNIVIKQGTLII